jgi:hypothetical protein
VGQLGLRDDLVEEAVDLFFKDDPTDFDKAMKSHFELLIDIRDQNLNHVDVKQRLIALKRDFAALLRKHGFTPNTGQIP